MKSIKPLIIMTFLLALALCGCDAARDGEGGVSPAPGGEDKLNIVCSLFPQYDFTRVIAGEHASVTQLLPPGIDSHEYEPSARDMLSARSADMFIYTDAALEGWVINITGALEGVKLVRCADGIDLEALNEEWEAAGGARAHEHAEERDEEHAHAYDAHIWLDPALAAVMCSNIKAALIAEDPANAADYEANCAQLIAELEALDADIRALIASHPGAKLYFGGKFAYSHFLRRYSVDFMTAYSTCSDEGEPGARAIVDIAENMKNEGAKVIFTDEMSSGAVARALAEQTGAQVMVFHTCHNLSKEDANKGLTFIKLMRMNMSNIQAALN